MNKSLIYSLFFILGLSALTITSCVKQDFDEPPSNDYPEVETNATIADIKEYFVADEYTTIDEDLVFSATVVANDSSGNYFKSLIIQDETGGIELSINAVNLFNQFPVGRKIYISAKGLVISDYNNLIQLGGNTYFDNGEERLGGIEEVLIDKYIVKGAPGHHIAAREITSFSDLNIDDQSTLVKLNGVQFIENDLNKTYADAENLQTVNLRIENCSGQEIILRTSGHSDFADEVVPDGNGTMTGIYSIFGTDRQFYIRSTDDVKFTGERCDGSGGGGDDCGFDEELISIQDLRNVYQGTPTKAPKDSKIRGVVISDRSKENIHGQNMIVQDDSGYGILIRFGESHRHNLGEEVEVVVHEADLAEFNGLLQLDNVKPSKSCSLGQTAQPEPVTMTIAELNDNVKRYESTLIKIENGKLSGGGGRYAGGTTLKDNTGSIELFTRFDATFSDDKYPTGDVDVVAIVSYFDKPQLSIRSAADVVGDDDGSGGGTGELIELPYFEDFTGGIPDDWLLTNTVGDRVWEGRSFDGEYYVQMGAFASGEIVDVTTWLITPEVDFESSSEKTIEVVLADAFENGNPLRVMYSTDYTEGDPSTATWVEVGRDQIDPLINNPDTYDNVYESSGKIDLSEITENAHMAFVYESGGTISTTIQLYSVEIR